MGSEEKMRKHLLYNEWMELYEDVVIDIYKKIKDTLQYECYKYHPITSISINEAQLFHDISYYIYKTSYTKERAYTMRNI